MLKTNYDNNSINLIAQHINSLCMEDLELASKVAACKKTAKDCYEYITTKAKEYLNHTNGCVEDKIVYEWALHFFLEEGNPSDAKKVVKKVESKPVKKAAKKKEGKKYEQCTLF